MLLLISNNTTISIGLVAYLKTLKWKIVQHPIWQINWRKQRNSRSDDWSNIDVFAVIKRVSRKAGINRKWIAPRADFDDFFKNALRLYVMFENRFSNHSILSILQFVNFSIFLLFDSSNFQFFKRSKFRSFHSSIILNKNLTVYRRMKTETTTLYTRK